MQPAYGAAEQVVWLIGITFFESQTERGNQVCARDESVLIDGVAHRRLYGASGKAVFSLRPARFHGVQVYVKVQDGINIDKVGQPTGESRSTCNLRALCPPRIHKASPVPAQSSSKA